MTNDLIAELKENPEFYVGLIIKLREQVSSLTLLNTEHLVLIDLERERSAELEKTLESLTDSDKQAKAN